MFGIDFLRSKRNEAAQSVESQVECIALIREITKCDLEGADRDTLLIIVQLISNVVTNNEETQQMLLEHAEVMATLVELFVKRQDDEYLHQCLKVMLLNWLSGSSNTATKIMDLCAYMVRAVLISSEWDDLSSRLMTKLMEIGTYYIEVLGAIIASPEVVDNLVGSMTIVHSESLAMHLNTIQNHSDFSNIVLLLHKFVSKAGTESIEDSLALELTCSLMGEIKALHEEFVPVGIKTPQTDNESKNHKVNIMKLMSTLVYMRPSVQRELLSRKEYMDILLYQFKCIDDSNPFLIEWTAVTLRHLAGNQIQ